MNFNCTWLFPATQPHFHLFFVYLFAWAERMSQPLCITSSAKELQGECSACLDSETALPLSQAMDDRTDGTLHFGQGGYEREASSRCRRGASSFFLSSSSGSVGTMST
ncbi:uncharacterized protein MONOS_16647 [Monocercomonoides exilis]|uniref:uncharacterized protein n=1 Tax=Monocercomonoides exilis TaxID=2049356 RepID=UPI003559C62E|nr:hypothetical protein MONOS_16647 [Monocercomonoides exilis]|eukprot:MONOS_16647.1-p1 / transcript=MONOS_16647.1 / gene=MONOS_16647 / organism=Monocercomonoides_exilis_PA203 / gene_product=unspecified product / transcript_product=unspecified product / location=Mono_scaffold01963:1188-1733(-) / protein_length=108 / sequence_SO=supercontig / SO=protein_coding / is_pseudo=false